MSGGEVGSYAELAFDPVYDEEEETLGACGCTDYHEADCPLLTDRSDDPDPRDSWDGDDWRDEP